MLSEPTSPRKIPPQKKIDVISYLNASLEKEKIERKLEKERLEREEKEFLEDCRQRNIVYKEYNSKVKYTHKDRGFEHFYQ